jgi:hypothetical protein
MVHSSNFKRCLIVNKQEWVKIYDALQTIGSISSVGLSEVQSSLRCDAYNQLWNLLTNNGTESISSAADKMGVELSD